MELLKQKIEELLTAGGFDFSVDLDSDSRRVRIFIHDESAEKESLPKLVFDLDHIVNIMAKKLQLEKISVDVNNYKKERERLITELAKATARKALLQKEAIELPAMNAYERRLVHIELATRPDLKTESIGEGPARRIVIKPL